MIAARQRYEKIRIACRPLAIGMLLILWVDYIRAAQLSPATEPAAAGPVISDAGITEPHISEAENALLIRARKGAKESAAKGFDILQAERSADCSSALDFALGVYALQAGKDTDSLSAFRTALRKMPTFHRARSNLAKLLIRKGEYAEAANELRVLLDGNVPGKGEFWRLLAFALAESDHPAAAETAFRNALVWAPDNEDLRLGLLKSILQQGETGRAAPMVRRELAKEPKNRDFWGILANVELTEGRPEEALVLLECARRVGAADMEMLLAIGDLKLDAGMPVEAVDAYGAAMELGAVPADRLLRAVRALVRRRRHDDAKRMVQTIVPQTESLSAPQRLTLKEVEAEVALLEEDNPRAQALYEEILADNPLHPGALFGLAEMLHTQNKLAEALVLYERAESLDDLRVNALTAQARIAVARGKFQDAIIIVTKALKTAPNPELEHYLAELRSVLAEK